MTLPRETVAGIFFVNMNRDWKTSGVSLSTVNAARPTAGAAHAAFELGECLLDTDTPRLRFLAGGDPTDPLIARERRNIFPHRPRRRRLNQGLP